MAAAKKNNENYQVSPSILYIASGRKYMGFYNPQSDYSRDISLEKWEAAWEDYNKNPSNWILYLDTKHFVGGKLVSGPEEDQFQETQEAEEPPF